MAAIGSAITAERALGDRVRARAQAVDDRVALLEAVYEPDLTAEVLHLARGVIARLGLGEAIDRFPLLLGSTAVEIGYVYEGVGTDFWPRFEAAVETTLNPAERRAVADAFRGLYGRLPLVDPVDSAFNDIFSIIAWPLAHALMPYELASGVSRLLSRAPVRALPRRGAPADFSGLRAWAAAAEGRRLTDWLKLEGPSGRVLAALLDENAAGRLTEPVFSRLHDAFRADWTSFTALDRGRERAASPGRARADAAGRLSLAFSGSRSILSVSWPPLPSGLEAAARAEARLKGWRPRLWGVAKTHAQNALSSGPIVLETDGGLPEVETPAYPDAAEVFGPGSDIASHLAARHVSWEQPLLFVAGDGDEAAERAATPLHARAGRIFLLAKKDPRWTALRRIAELDGGLAVRELDLAQPEHRDILRQAGLWTEKGAAVLARHPVDAAQAERRQVSPGRPFACWTADTAAPPETVAGAVRIAPRSAGPVQTAMGAVQAVPARSAPRPPIVTIACAEGEDAFEALVQRRLALTVSSPWTLQDLEAKALLFVGERLIAVSSAKLEQAPGPINAAHPLLATLMQEPVREALLEVGAGRLIVRLGRTDSEIRLERSQGRLSWDAAGKPLGAVGELVSASANRPASFGAALQPSPSARALRLEDGRLASPAWIEVDDRLDVSAVAPGFDGRPPVRRSREGGMGVAELAAARRAWAAGECRSLAALAVKSRAAAAFERPLVRALCGETWVAAEGRAETSYWTALWSEAHAAGLTQPRIEPSRELWEAFQAAFIAPAEALQPAWTGGADIDGAALDQALDLSFAEAVGKLEAEGRSQDVDLSLEDLGAPEEDWQAVAGRATDAVERPRLCGLLAPPSAVDGLRRRDYQRLELQEAAVLLADWCARRGSPRAKLDEEGAMDALLFWLAPATGGDPERTARRLAQDRFTARTTRYLALRLGAGPVG